MCEYQIIERADSLIEGTILKASLKTIEVVETSLFESQIS